jgi:serpin B
MPRLTTDPSDAVAAADAINAFGLDLYGRFATNAGNLVISPASVALALSMARVGARGATATEMDQVLRGLGSDELAKAASALDAALAARSGTFPDMAGEDQQVVLRIANALFPQRDLPLESTFLDAMASRYGAGAWLVDYRADPEAARLAINAWVAEQTENRIPSILAPGDVTAAWRLALANAIYLKAAWLEPFLEDATAPADFRLRNGATVSVPTMHALVTAPTAAGPGWRAIELPYVGRELAMLIVVPDELAAFEPGFTPARLDEIVGSIQQARVNLWLPRFDIESRAELGALLEALGMPTAFSGSADFSGITTAEALRIASVIHQANMTVDENGTEAAAATVVGMDTSGGGPEPVELRVDRPFLVVLRDLPTGAIVFLGRVADPSQVR